MSELIESIQIFLETGGDVLYWIGAVLLVMWTFIFERVYYYSFTYPKEARLLIAKWDAREDTTSWRAHRIRDAWVSQTRDKLNANLTLIKTLVAVCPLLGLLGTVTGMIQVFENMAMLGTGNARVMAGGIFQATIPTMAGMVAALSGLFVSTRLELTARMRSAQFADHLPHH